MLLTEITTQQLKPLPNQTDSLKKQTQFMNSLKSKKQPEKCLNFQNETQTLQASELNQIKTTQHNLLIKLTKSITEREI